MFYLRRDSKHKLWIYGKYSAIWATEKIPSVSHIFLNGSGDMDDFVSSLIYLIDKITT